MPEEKERQGMSREEAGRKGGEASKGSEKHFTPESKERLKEGATKGGEHSGGGSSERNISKESREKMSEGGRKGGEK
jgi:general stress protein YciG